MSQFEENAYRTLQETIERLTRERDDARSLAREGDASLIEELSQTRAERDRLAAELAHEKRVRKASFDDSVDGEAEIARLRAALEYVRECAKRTSWHYFLPGDPPVDMARWIDEALAGAGEEK